MASNPSVPDEQFDALKRIINADPEIKKTLTNAKDQQSWIDAVVSVANAKGINISASDVVGRVKRKMAAAVDSGRALGPIVMFGHHSSSAHTI